MFCFIVVVESGKTITAVKKEAVCKGRSRILHIPSVKASNPTATSNARYANCLTQTTLNGIIFVGVKPQTKIF
jgi:hypothetical protein